MKDINQLKNCYLGLGESEPISILTPYLKGAPIHVDKITGLVHVKNRRSPDVIAKAWSDEVYGDKISNSSYTARNPFFKARHVFVADFIDVALGLKGKRLIDFGAGEGQFLEIARNNYGAIPFGLEPSRKNCGLMSDMRIENFCGTIEDFTPGQPFDVLTMMWTLCNVGNCFDAVVRARNALKEGGYLVVAESSRILVPFKKPLHTYVCSKLETDLHPWHFSVNTLCTLLEIAGFEIVKTNRFFDQDNLVVIAQKKANPKQKLLVDDSAAVVEFFQRWHNDSQFYKEFQYDYC